MVAYIVAAMAGSARRRHFQTAFNNGFAMDAFQIADDLLDFEGDAEVTGKEPGNDVMTGKVTLPIIYSLKKVGKDARTEMIKLLNEKFTS